MSENVLALEKLFHATSKIRDFGKVSTGAFEKLAEKKLIKSIGL
jgi:hypothetical protein